jgi:hypothetical protein
MSESCRQVAHEHNAIAPNNKRVCWRLAPPPIAMLISLRYFHQTSDFLTSLSVSFEHHFKSEDWTWHPFLLAIAEAKARQGFLQQEQDQENKLHHCGVRRRILS